MHMKRKRTMAALVATAAVLSMASQASAASPTPQTICAAMDSQMDKLHPPHDFKPWPAWLRAHWTPVQTIYRSGIGALRTAGANRLADDFAAVLVVFDRARTSPYAVFALVDIGKDVTREAKRLHAPACAA